MKIAILILNWNGKMLLETFLPYVIKYSKGHEIFLIDNASQDDSVAFVKTKFLQINTIELSKNYGYAQGYNKAVKQVKADIYCFLNSDVRVTPNWLEPVKKVFAKHPQACILQPKILDEKENDKFEYAGAAGGFIDQLGYPYCRGRIFETIEKDNGQYDGISEVFWASGACFFIRAKTFNELGGFDNNFFAHMEEIDLCWRAHNLGHKVFCVGTSKIYHLGGQSIPVTNPNKTFLNFRNSLLTLTKNSSHPLFASIFLRLILDGFAGLKFITQGRFNHLVAIIQAHMSFYRHFPLAFNYRKKNKNRKGYKSVTSIVWKYYILKIKTFRKLKTH